MYRLYVQFYFEILILVDGRHRHRNRVYFSPRAQGHCPQEICRKPTGNLSILETTENDICLPHNGGTKERILVRGTYHVIICQ